jgi:hypothetical protein
LLELKEVIKGKVVEKEMWDDPEQDGLVRY